MKPKPISKDKNFAKNFFQKNELNLSLSILSLNLLISNSTTRSTDSSLRADTGRLSPFRQEQYLPRVQSNQWASHAKKVRSKRTVRLHKRCLCQSMRHFFPSDVNCLNTKLYTGQDNYWWLHCQFCPGHTGVKPDNVEYLTQTRLHTTGWGRLARQDYCSDTDRIRPFRVRSLRAIARQLTSHKSATPLSHLKPETLVKSRQSSGSATASLKNWLIYH